MGNNARLREMAAAFIGSDIPGVADIHICIDATATQTPYQFWNKWAMGERDYQHTTITAAINACTGGRNDVVLITPDSHTQAASIAWNENMTHLVGMYPTTMMNMRSRIGHSATVDPLLNITGYGCLFKGIYLMYGLNNATDLTCVKVTGNRNTFKHCHFNAPTNAAPADVATFKVIHFTETSGGDGLEHYFDHCTIGNDTTAWTNGDMMKTAGTPRLVFENCVFLMRGDNNQLTFIDGTAGDGQGFVLFKNCAGMNLGTEITVAIGSTGLAAGTDYILLNSGFSGAADLIAEADEAKAKMIATGITADEQVGLAIDFDHTA
jgi:hypothetical protein